MIEFPRSDRFGNVTSIDGRPLLRATGPSPFFRSRKPLDIFVIDPVLGILGAVENIAAGVRGLVHGKEVTVADRNPLKFPDRPRSRSIARYRAAAAEENNPDQSHLIYMRTKGL